MKYTSKSITELVELHDKKKKELDLKGKRSSQLQLKADKIYFKNLEQWDAYQKCIEHQQKRMMELIHELSLIYAIIESLSSQGG